MAERTLNVEVRFDTRTKEAWTAETTVIPKGFLCIELSTVDVAEGESTVSKPLTKLKVGDGVKTYAALNYVTTDTEMQLDAAIKDAMEQLNHVWHIAGKVATFDELPASGEDGDIYLVGAADATEYQEYYWTGSGWDYLGLTNATTLSDYYTKTETDTKLADKLDVNDTYTFNVTLNTTSA